MRRRIRRVPRFAVLLVVPLAALAIAGYAEADQRQETSTSSTITIGSGPSTPAPGATGAAPTISTSVDICTIQAYLFRAGTRDYGGQGSVFNCTEATEVLTATVKIWEKGSNGNYIDLAQKTYGGGSAPYTTSPTLFANCTAGLNVHVEFEGTISSKSGVGSWDDINTGPLTCK